MEIDNLGVLGRPEHRTPVEEKIQKAIFRGLQNTGTPNTSWENFRGAIFISVQDPRSRIPPKNCFLKRRRRLGKKSRELFWGVFGTPENRTPVGEKIRGAIFRGAWKTGTPDTEK